MSSGRRRLERAAKKWSQSKQARSDELPAKLGTSRGGSQIVAIPNREGWVYVRVRGDQSEELSVFNDQVNNVYDLPVTIVRDPGQAHYRVKGRDIKAYETWTGMQTGGISPHAPTHSRKPDNPGNDIVDIYKSQFMPLAMSPWPTGTAMAAVVRADYYIHNGEMMFWPGGGTVSLAPAKPTTNKKRFITVAIDAPNETLEYFSGELFTDDPVIVDYTPYIPMPNLARYIPVGAVLLSSSTQYLSYSIMHDIRPLWHTILTGTLTEGSSTSAAFWQPLTNGVLTGTELVWADGDVIMVEGDDD